MTEQTTNTVIDEPAHDAVVVSNTPIQFDVTSAAIAEMQIKADSLSIDGPDDKAGYNAVYELRQVVKKQRIAIEKKAKELKAPHVQYNKQVDSLAKSLVEPMEAIEDQLAHQEKEYNDERERLAHERAMFLQNRTEGRVNDLRRLGFQWCDSDDKYTLFGFDEEDILMEINFDDIKNFSDEEYEPTRLGAHMSWEHLQERIKERNRLAEEERIRKENEAKAEAERLAKIAADQKAEADRLAAAAKQLEEAEERARQIELKARLVIRTPQLVALGYVEHDEYYLHPASKMWKSYIQSLTDEEFDDKMFNLEYTVQEWEQKQKAIRLKQLTDDRVQKLLANHFELEDEDELGCQVYVYGGLSVDTANLPHLTDEKFDGILAEAQQHFSELKAWQEEEKRKADKERVARLKPDRKHLRIYFETAGELVHPPITQPESEQLVTDFTLELTLLVNKYLDRIDTL